MCARVIAWESACRPLHAQTTLNTSLETLKLPRPAHHQQSQAHSVSHTDAETSSPKHFKAKLHRQKCSFEVRCTGSDRRTRLTRLSPIRSEKPFSPCCTAVHLLDRPYKLDVTANVSGFLTSGRHHDSRNIRRCPSHSPEENFRCKEVTAYTTSIRNCSFKGSQIRECTCNAMQTYRILSSDRSPPLRSDQTMRQATIAYLSHRLVYVRYLQDTLRLLHTR